MERKIGTEKIIRLFSFNYKFTSNMKILALLLVMQNIRLLVNFDEKYLHNLII